MVKVYNYNLDGKYLGYSEADESPLEEGVFLIPANATTIKPPNVDERYEAVFNNNEWISMLKEKEVPTVDVLKEGNAGLPKNDLEILKEQVIELQSIIVDLTYNNLTGGK